jgi:penicillin-binding protein 2
MTLLRDQLAATSQFRLRLWVAVGFVAVCFGLLLARLTVLQVSRHDALSEAAEANRVTVLPITPNRGQILDRHGVVLASNYSAYTLEITPSRVAAREGGLDALIDALAAVIDIQPRDRKRFHRLLADGKRFDSLPIRNRLSDEEVARFAAQRWRFPGVDVQARLFRHYPHGELGAHLIGTIGRISARDRDAMEDWDEERLANYRGTDHIGKLGLEQAYEDQLHGLTGFQEVETSAGGRAVRSLGHRPPKPGQTLHLAVDIRLQHLIEQLFGERRGALVAIDPRNGEVLALVSKPGYDPNLFVDGIDVENWTRLNEDPDKPLLNRAIRGTYPPGSTYKPFMALAALQTGARAPDTIINDTLVYHFGGRAFGSPSGERGGAMNMRRSIVESSNVYYYSLANQLGVDRIHEQLLPLGLGRRTGIDLPGEVTGVLPSKAWKKQVFKQDWYPGETISLGIGQGYNSLHAAADGQRHRHPGQRRPALRAAPGARGRGPGGAPAPARGRPGPGPSAAAGHPPRAHRPAARGAARRDLPGHQHAGLCRRGLQERWQDRHRAGRRFEEGPEIQRLADGRAPTRPQLVHGLRTGR